jgi:nicotinate-nucleotide pyrophosphorylase (carboxylating)
LAQHAIGLPLLAATSYGVLCCRISAVTTARAELLCKEQGVIAGLGVADNVLQAVDAGVTVEWFVTDGQKVDKGQTLGCMHGSAASLLVAERVLLNFMQRMSGIATLTAQMVEAIGEYPSLLLETRKTVPGLRLLDKWAVLLGGGHNHRMGLYDMMMIKDNHIAAAGGIPAAVQRAEQYIQEHALTNMQVEIETRTVAEVEEVMHILTSSTTTCISR